MKRTELDVIFTNKVNEYLARGYVFNTNTMSGSQGEIAHVDLRKGDEILRIVMDGTASMIGAMATRFIFWSVVIPIA